MFSLRQTFRADTRSDWLSSLVPRIGLIRWCETTPPVSESVRPISRLSARTNHRTARAFFALGGLVSGIGEIGLAFQLARPGQRAGQRFAIAPLSCEQPPCVAALLAWR